jgi:putative peptidoglycan lipid II flippase
MSRRDRAGDMVTDYRIDETQPIPLGLTPTIPEVPTGRAPGRWAAGPPALPYSAPYPGQPPAPHPGEPYPGRPPGPSPGQPGPYRGQPPPGPYVDPPTVPHPGRPTAPPRGAPGGFGPGSRRRGGEPSLGRSSRIMAIASATSRLTGFLRSLAIAAAIGLDLVGDAYNTANTLPNIVYELLLGGVLTSVVVPLLVHAQERDPDGGEAYTQRLLSLSTATLAVATGLAVLAAPVLTALYVGSSNPKAHLTTVFAWLLLPEIFFYGIGAMFGAILNTRGVYGPPAWAPVLNNVIVIATAGLFILLPGPATLALSTITTAQVLVLGIGTTLGIIGQAFVLMPSLRASGFRWRWRLDLRGSRLSEAGTLAGWVIGYVVVSQIGYVVVTRLANEVSVAGRGYAVFTNASLLFQMPYGVLGVSLLTALMPRMSRAAARGDRAGVVADLSLGSRLSALALVPITAGFIVLGPAIGTLVYGHGRTTGDAARQVGVVLAASAFGLVPFAITMLQLRVFYAVKDARTPTLINIGMVATKIAFCAVVARALPDRHVVTGLAVATSLSYIVGVVLGEVLLRRRFGPLDGREVVRTTVRITMYSAFGALAAWGVLVLASHRLGTGFAGSAVGVLLGSAAGLAVLAALASRVRFAELDQVLGGRGGRRPRSSGRHRAH